MLALGAAESQRLAEAAFAQVRATAGMVESVEVGVIEKIDARFARRGVERADLVIGAAGNAHHARDDIGNPSVG
ncbi:hypothetical protein D3C76_1808820 [compost metagenome]